jgi:hypothetical protein
MHFFDPIETRSLLRRHAFVRWQKVPGNGFSCGSRLVALRGSPQRFIRGDEEKAGAASRTLSMCDPVDESMFPAAAPHPVTAVRKIATRTRPYSTQIIVMRISYTTHRNKGRFP